MASLTVDPSARARANWPARRHGMVTFRTSPLARRIVVFNLLAVVLMAAGVLTVAPFRAGMVDQRQTALEAQARLIAALVDAAGGSEVGAVRRALEDIGGESADAFIFDAQLRLVGSRHDVGETQASIGAGYFTGALHDLWNRAAEQLGSPPRLPPMQTEERARALASEVMTGGVATGRFVDAAGRAGVSSAAALGGGAGAVVLTSRAGEIDRLVRTERERVLRMFAVAVVVSITVSILLARTIVTPLAQLAEAVETGRDRCVRAVGASRVRIPDLTARPDEIGWLSGALRGMVAALYERIDANEAFAADVAHEVKNPLVSLRSAVEALRVARDDERQARMLDVIEQDVRRLDRLVSDISNASRLDSELVREGEESFDLLNMVRRLADYFTHEASAKGIEVIADLPDGRMMLRGLEARLAQVVVNVVCNAISFCEEGDAIRVWVRRRDRRVLLVVEDTGPGIPEEALDRIFARFYSERPAEQFGNNSGLGLAISKQIVEAHGGVIWAENIRPTQADITSDPLGARFVVGLPV